jgi:hypothetical protein
LTVEEASGAAVEVWPDNVLILNTFISMSTQWRVGPGGATGLDYNALPGVMRMIGIPAADRSDVFEGVRVMEDAALTLMREAKK